MNIQPVTIASFRRPEFKRPEFRRPEFQGNLQMHKNADKAANAQDSYVIENKINSK